MKKFLAVGLLFTTITSAFATTQIDAVILYSDGANKLYNNDAITKIEHLVNTTNQIYKDSGLDIKLNPVKIEKININDSLNSQDALKEAQSRDDIKKIRENLGADEVIVLRPYVGDGICGIAYQNNNIIDKRYYDLVKDYAYAHVSINCGSETMAHEVGHNMGLGHSKAQNSTGAFKYAIGYGVENEFVTIMAYESAYNAKRINKFSSPNLNCNGLPCGVEDEADAVRALKQTAPLVANFEKHIDIDKNTTTNKNTTNNNEKNTKEQLENLYNNLIKKYNKLLPQYKKAYQDYVDGVNKLYNIAIEAKNKYKEAYQNYYDAYYEYKAKKISYAEAKDAYKKAKQAWRVYAKAVKKYNTTSKKLYNKYKTERNKIVKLISQIKEIQQKLDQLS